MVRDAVGSPEEAARLLREAADLLSSSTSSKRPRDESAEAGARGVASAAARVGFLGGNADPIDGLKTVCVLTVPHSSIGNLIGKAGAHIKQLELDAGLNEICIEKAENPNSLGRNITLIGSASACSVGCYLIFRALHERAIKAGDARSSGQTFHEWMEVAERSYGPKKASFAQSSGGSNKYGDGMSSYTPAPAPYSAPWMPDSRPALQAYAAQSYAPPTAQSYAPLAAQSYALPTAQSYMPPTYAEYPRQPYSDQLPSYSSPPASSLLPPKTMVAQASGEALALEMQCPAEKVGRVIGKGGSNIKDLESKSGTVIAINQDVPAGQPRIVTIKGPALNVAVARDMIANIINA